MSEYLHGWRSKCGLIALFLTCVLAAGWVRSLSVQDRFGFRKVTIASFRGEIGLFKTELYDVFLSGVRSIAESHTLLFKMPYWYAVASLLLLSICLLLPAFRSSHRPAITIQEV